MKALIVGPQGCGKTTRWAPYLCQKKQLDAVYTANVVVPGEEEVLLFEATIHDIRFVGTISADLSAAHLERWP